MPATGTWASHTELAARLLKVHVEGWGRFGDESVVDENVITDAAAAIRDLGDRLDAAMATIAAFRPFVERVARARITWWQVIQESCSIDDVGTARKALEEEGR